MLNAGTQHAVKEIAHLSTEQLEYTFATNVFSLFWSVQEALPHMEAGRQYHHHFFDPGFPAVVVPDRLCRIEKRRRGVHPGSLAKQLAPKGIRVNSVAPGPVWTPLQVSGAQQPENIPGFGSRTPLGRAGQPVEVAPSYVFLASEESSYITAQIIGVTGRTLHSLNPATMRTPTAHPDRLTAEERRELDDNAFGIPSRREFPLVDAAHVRAAESYFRYAPEADKPALARRILRQAAEFGIEIRSETILRWAARTAKR